MKCATEGKCLFATQSEWMSVRSRNIEINHKVNWLIVDWMRLTKKLIKVGAKTIKRNKCENTLTCLFTLFSKFNRFGLVFSHFHSLSVRYQ